VAKGVDFAALDRELDRVFGERRAPVKAFARVIATSAGFVPSAMTQREIGLRAGYTSSKTCYRAIADLLAEQFIVAYPINSRRDRYSLHERFRLVEARRAV
jgi:hypothetical protein